MSDLSPNQPRLLGPLERRVMERLWVAGSQTVTEVQAALNRSHDRELAYTTVMTILVRLHEKGLVTRRKEGRHYCYSSAVNEASLSAELGRRELSRLIQRYGVDSVAGFAAELGQDELADRLAELATEPGHEP